MVLRIVAPPHGEILAANVRAIIYKMADVGCHFGKITYDSFGSMESVQQLQSQGYNAEEFSLDTSTEGYEMAKMAICDGRVLCYRVPILATELGSLMLDEKKQKVDHPPAERTTRRIESPLLK